MKKKKKNRYHRHYHVHLALLLYGRNWRRCSMPPCKTLNNVVKIRPIYQYSICLTIQVHLLKSVKPSAGEVLARQLPFIFTPRIHPGCEKRFPYFVIEGSNTDRRRHTSNKIKWEQFSWNFFLNGFHSKHQSPFWFYICDTWWWHSDTILQCPGLNI